MSKDFEERRLSGLTIRIDRRTCIGSGSCVTIAPDVLELDSQMTVTFRDDAGEIDRERLVEACSVCPVDALAALDDGGVNLAR